MSRTNIKKPAPPKKQEARTAPDRSDLYIRLLLLAFCFVLYGNTLRNDYSLDDDLVTWNNPQVRQGIRALPEIFTTFYYEASGNAGTLAFGYRPVAKATYAIEHSLFGQNAPVSHFINILLYAATILLLYHILKRLFRNTHFIFPLAVTLLFAAHPLHTEVVASLKNREELLSFLGALAGLWYFLKYADTSRSKNLLLGLLFFFLGYLSKSSVMPFLVLYPLTLYFFSDIPAKRLISLSVMSGIVLLVAQLGPALFLPDTIRPNALIENPLYFEKDLLIRSATGFTGLLHYLKLHFWPHPMLFYYGYDTFPMTGWGSGKAILSLVAHAGLFAVAVYHFKRQHVLSFAILFYLISIAMYSNILIPVVGIVGDRFTYLASLGFVIFAAWAVFRFAGVNISETRPAGGIKTRLTVLLLLLLVPYTALTIRRNSDWKDLPTLFGADISHLERSVKANTQYAGNLLYNTYMAMQEEKGRPSPRILEEMIRHYHRSLAIMPDYYDALTGLGTVYSTLSKEYTKAIPYFEAAIRADSANVAGYVNLAYVYGEMGDNGKSAAYYRKVLQMDSTKVRAYFKLAEIALQKGDTTEAIHLNLVATRFDPYTDVPYLNIGNYKLFSRDTLGAVVWYEKAAAKQPNHELSVKLYMHYSKTGDAEKAAYYKKMAAETKNVVTVPRN